MVSRSVNAVLETAPLARLAQMGLPPRIRSLVEGAHLVAMPIINSGLERAVEELERDLLAHVDRTLHDDEQALCLASLRELKNQRGEFIRQCTLAIQRPLVAMVRHYSLAGMNSDDSLAEPEPEGSREERTTLAQIAARAEIRAAAGLHGLAHRFAVIAGTPVIELEVLALGPQQLCTAICAAASRLNLAPAHRMSLFRRIDKGLFGEAAQLYAAINGYLVEHRVFAHLQTAPRPAAEPPARPAPVPGPAIPPETVDLPAPQPVPVAPLSPAVPAPASARDAARSEARTAPDAPLDLHFFRGLRDALAARRRAQAAPEAAAERDRPIADKADVLAALGVLQLQAPAPVMIGGKWENRGIAHIRQDLMSHLRGRLGGVTPRLRDEDSDSIEMIALLFGRLLAPFPGNSIRHALLSRLQIPILRVVLKDPGFFPRRTHPARRLLESVCAAVAYWIEDEDADRATLERLQGVVDRLLKEYSEQLVAFDQAQEEVERIVGALQKKAEIAERRHVEAARGREKLDLAQAAAEEAVRELLDRTAVPLAVRSLLENAWTDALALALLRQGVDHPTTHQRLELVDALVRAFSQPPAHARAALDALRGVLEQGLAAIGFHDDAITSAWDELCRLATAPEAGDAAARSISTLLQQRPRLGGEARAGDADNPAMSSPGREAPGQAAAADRIRQLPPGSWLEFVAKPAAVVVRRRFCWFSAVTGRTVLLSPRGGKGEECSLDHLAHELASGRLRILPDGHDQLIDRAWREVMSTLRDGIGGVSGGSNP
jgi:hypothetical protein